jgi:protein ImuA
VRQHAGPIVLVGAPYPVFTPGLAARGLPPERLLWVRAEPPAYNAPDLLDLSLFLAWRAQGLAIESPGVRR